MRKNSSSTKALAAALLCGALTVPFAASAADLTVPMDQVRMITFRSPVKTVFVGNPLIADVTVVDSTRIFLMGKNFGTTNLVALDDAGNQISNDRVTVQARGGDVVTLHRGSSQTTMACAGGRCQTSPQPGDEQEAYTTVNDQLANREQTLTTAAGGQ